MSGVRTVEVLPADDGVRLDRWFRRHFPDLGHGRLEKLLRTGQVRLDGARVKSSVRVATAQKVRVPPLGSPSVQEGEAKPKESQPVSEDDSAALQRAILYRDADVLVLNKPPGLAVQGGSGITKSLDSMLDALQLGAAERPRLVHRLDQDTSGVLLLARSAAAAARLGAAFRARETRKIYWAIVVGVPVPNQGCIDLAIAKKPSVSGDRVAPDEDAGKRAVTYYSVLEKAGDRAALVALLPVTGRTHQLRVHLAAIGTPILGDGKYGGRGAFVAGLPFAKNLHLHARSIAVRFDRREIAAVAPLPEHMAETFAFFGFDANDRTDPFVELDA